MGQMKTYDPKKVSVIVGTKAMSGFMEGSLVSIERDEDAFTKVVGADGEVARAKTNNRAGNITIPLMQTSESNDYLSTLAALDEADNAGVVPVLIRDALGRTIVSARQAWVRKIPSVTFERDNTGREWILDCGDLEVFVGGN